MARNKEGESSLQETPGAISNDVSVLPSLRMVDCRVYTNTMNMQNTIFAASMNTILVGIGNYTLFVFP